MANNMNTNNQGNQVPPIPPQYPQQPPMQNFGGNNRPPKKKTSKWVWVLVAIVAFIGLPAFFAGLNGDEIKDSTKQETKISKEDAESDIIADLKGNPEYMDSIMVRAKQTSAPDMLLGYVRDVKAMADKKVTDSTYMDIYSKPEVVKLMDENSAKAKKILPELMRICRKQYAENARNKLWEENIDVETSNGGTTITFIGGVFANRKYIKQWQNEVGRQLTELGFKRVQYKWIPHDPDYTYYDL